MGHKITWQTFADRFWRQLMQSKNDRYNTYRAAVGTITGTEIPMGEVISTLKGEWDTLTTKQVQQLITCAKLILTPEGN